VHVEYEFIDAGFRRVHKIPIQSSSSTSKSMGHIKAMYGS
jgi:hypothetical protein